MAAHLLWFRKWVLYKTFRNAVLDVYGGVCRVCGEADKTKLVLHHVYGDGEADRRGWRGMRNMGGHPGMKHLASKCFPPGRCVLCYGCHGLIHRTGRNLKPLFAMIPKIQEKEAAILKEAGIRAI